MASKELNVKLKQRYDTASNWTTNNPVLLAGELGIESDTKKMKVGDGTTSWNSLAYMIATPELPSNIAYTDQPSEFTAPQKFSSRDGYIELGSVASVNDNGVLKLLSAITVSEDGENVYDLLFPKKSGTIALLEDAQGLEVLSEDFHLADLEPNLYLINAGSGNMVKFYYNGSTTDEYVSIENGFLNVIKGYDTVKEFFGDIRQYGQKKAGQVFDQRHTHSIILGWGSSTGGYCASTYINGADPLITKYTLDNNYYTRTEADEKFSGQIILRRWTD